MSAAATSRDTGWRPAGRLLEVTRPVRHARSARRRRTMIVSLLLVVLIALMFGASMIVGDFPLGLDQLWYALTGRGTTATNFIVYELRLPRVLTGLLVGLCFGISGAVFQSMIKNPLASPDIIGISYGASASGVLAILLLGWSGFAVSASAFVGAIAVAVLIYLLAWRSGLSGYRFVLVGIGISALTLSVIDFLITRANVYEAQTALIWLTGSLSGASNGQLAPLLISALVLVPLTLLAGRWLAVLQLGDDTAVSVGLRLERSRLILIVLGVALAAVATAAAGPVGFVAFVSGPIARRLVGGSGVALLPAGLVGALVVCLADFAGQHLLPVELPVGVLTAAIGAPYLVFLLITSNRSGTGG